MIMSFYHVFFAPSSVLSLVLSDCGLMVGAGIAIGVLLSFATAHLAKALLYGLVSNDPATFVMACGILMVASVSAAFVPAYKASRTDPMTALRCE